MNGYVFYLRTKIKKSSHNVSSRRRGIVASVIVFMLPVLMGMAALTIDIGYLRLVRQELQKSADAGALAAVWTLFDENGNLTPAFAQQSALTVANMNTDQAVHDFTFGWIEDPLDPMSPFVPVIPEDANAVRVISSRTEALGNPVNLFFAGIFGITSSNVSASAVAAYTPADSVDGVPLALPAPGFGPVDPDIVVANPGKYGPSEPADGIAFQIGEQVTLFIFGKGKKSPVHIVLNTNDIPGETEIGKVLRGDSPPVLLTIGDEIDVLGEGTGHGGLGGKMASRLDDDNPANDTVILPLVETLPNSRNAWGELTGNVRVIDFVAVHLDGVVETSVPDPNDPQDNGKTIDIKKLVGTIVQKSVSGRAATTSSGVVDVASVRVPQLIR